MLKILQKSLTLERKIRLDTAVAQEVLDFQTLKNSTKTRRTLEVDVALQMH